MGPRENMKLGIWPAQIIRRLPICHIASNQLFIMGSEHHAPSRTTCSQSSSKAFTPGTRILANAATPMATTADVSFPLPSFNTLNLDPSTHLALASDAAEGDISRPNAENPAGPPLPSFSPCQLRAFASVVESVYGASEEESLHRALTSPLAAPSQQPAEDSECPTNSTAGPEKPASGLAAGASGTGGCGSSTSPSHGDSIQSTDAGAEFTVSSSFLPLLRAGALRLAPTAQPQPPTSRPTSIHTPHLQQPPRSPLSYLHTGPLGPPCALDTLDAPYALDAGPLDTPLSLDGPGHGHVRAAQQQQPPSSSPGTHEGIRSLQCPQPPQPPIATRPTQLPLPLPLALPFTLPLRTLPLPTAVTRRWTDGAAAAAAAAAGLGLGLSFTGPRGALRFAAASSNPHEQQLQQQPSLLLELLPDELLLHILTIAGGGCEGRAQHQSA